METQTKAKEATTASVRKVLNYLAEQKTPITKTEITLACSLPSTSITSILDLLEKMNQIEIWSNSKVHLIKLKQPMQNATTN